MPSQGKLIAGEYILQRQTIGEGAFGKVVQGQHIYSKKDFAVKIFSLELETHKNAFKKEVHAAAMCFKHTYKTKVYKAFELANHGFIVMDLMKYDLLTLMGKTGVTYFNEQQAKAFFHQILAAVEEMHLSGVAHLDIKPDNILIAQDGSVRLCDYGAAVSFTSCTTCTTRDGTDAYQAPEVKAGTGFFPPAADMWSLGVTLYVILTGVFPYRIDTVNPYSMSSFSMNTLHYYNLSAECTDFLVKLLQPVPANRITIREAVSHPWISSLTLKSSR